MQTGHSERLLLLCVFSYLFRERGVQDHHFVGADVVWQSKHRIKTEIKAFISLLQCDGEDDILVCFDLDDLGLWQEVVARRYAPSELGLPLLHVPLQPLGRYNGGSLDGYDADVLPKQPCPVRDQDIVLARLKQERQAFFRYEVHATLTVARILLKNTQVVHLTEALVDSATQSAYGHDVAGLVGPGADVGDRFGKVGRLLFCDLDDLWWAGEGGIELGA